MSQASPNFDLGLGFEDSQPPPPPPPPEPQRICCVGAGRLGVLSMLVMADRCANVEITVTDTDAAKILAWNRNQNVPINDAQLLRFPVYEPGLLQLYLQVRATNRLSFSYNVNGSMANADLIFIAVDIPSVKQPAIKKGRKELGEWDRVCRIFKETADFQDKVVVTITTVPPDFKKRVRQIFDVSDRFLYNPSFMREGTAIEDLRQPSRVIIAYESDADPNTVLDVTGVTTLQNLYLQWVLPVNITVINGFAIASLGKFVVSICLANRISTINSVSEACNLWGVNFSDVYDLLRSHPDLRDDSFNPQPGVGFGGELVDDLSHMALMANSNGLTEVGAFYNSIAKVNEAVKKSFVKVMHDKMNSLKGKTIAILGFTHKIDTENIKNSPGIQICEEILKDEKAAGVRIFDLRANGNDIKLSIVKTEQSKVKVLSSAYEACLNADAILILTVWPEFLNLNYTHIHNNLMTRQSTKDIFIGRHIDNFPDLEPLGFHVHYIGRQ